MGNIEKNSESTQTAKDVSTDELNNPSSTHAINNLAGNENNQKTEDGETTNNLGDVMQTKMLGDPQHGTRMLGDQAGVVDEGEKTEPLPVIPSKLRVIMPDGKIAVYDSIRPHLLVGRRTLNNKANIDIDLNPYDAGMKGVSRLHAKIAPDERYGLSIKDINSVNGTFINGELLRTQTAYPLKSGDNIKFGNLKIQIFFGYD